MFTIFTSKKNEIKVLIAILAITFVVYLNHFDNPFFFDDTHTISENESIRNLSNWTSFFTNADTFSSLPANRAYRPMITLMNAIDYSFAGGLNSRYYHYHIFFWFLVLIVLIYLITRHLYNIALPKHKYIGITSLFATAWFALHTANAETINYICARSDSFSTLCIVASLLLYIHPIGKKWHLYLITMIIGIWTKQTGVMFFPILFIYILLFEEHSLISDFKKDTKEKILRIIKRVAPAAIIASFLFLFNQYYLTPISTDSTNFSVTRFEYFSTQWYVIMHYLGNFILPVNLSADPDITIIKPWYSLKTLSGLIIILGMIFIMIKTALKKDQRPISFGLAWFFIALLPTTLNPLFQIANDHRMFFPFIGLFIAVPWGGLMLIKKYNVFENNNKKNIQIALLLSLILIGHAYGTVQRNKVWDSGESLWFDVVTKSPKNGRGLMNYGLTHMAKGNYEIALDYFNRAIELTPNYYTLHINLAILYGGTNNHLKAIEHFESALHLNSSSPAPEYYYARYLVKQEEFQKASIYLNQAIAKSPNHTKSKELLTQISGNIKTPQEEVEILLNKINESSSPELYLELSIKYYEMKEYKMSITACKEILKIDPRNADAYNNMCVAYNQLKQWELGAEACRKAITINPDFQLAKNNLKWATDNIQ
ncbi:tetratricopeptide repeat protein [Aquimarina aquimarini]|uniref:tetratricopeptide repeat protein n=1 Tax=Aquimarina aquimarini TaxID=1191734 RepID=UPI000D560615|nr:tetratricopeptide repeat protein [Aquimarina aquimarini]